jgi:hypothetical protein
MVLNEFWNLKLFVATLLGSSEASKSFLIFFIFRDFGKPGEGVYSLELSNLAGRSAVRVNYRFTGS